MQNYTNDNEGGETVKDEDYLEELALINEQQQFYESFANKIIAFDPLGRPFLDYENNDLMTKCEQLIKMLEGDLVPIKGECLQPMLNNDQIALLMSKFNDLLK